MDKIEIKDGTIFGRLTVLSELDRHIQPNGKKVRKFLCRCSCGNVVSVFLPNLRRGTTMSCGCLHKEKQHKVNNYDVDGNTVRVYDCKGTYALIDIEDLEKVKPYYWGSYNSYFKGSINGKGIWLHRFIMNCPEGLVVDHLNGDPKDNRKCNLRICTQADNMQNKRVKGCSFNKAKQKWEAYIGVNYKRIYLGSFLTEQGAIEARKQAENIYYI